MVGWPAEVVRGWERAALRVLGVGMVSVGGERGIVSARLEYVDVAVVVARTGGCEDLRIVVM